MEETPRISASRSPKKWSKFFFWKYLFELRGKSGYITCVKVLRGGMGVEGGKLELAFHRPLGSEIIMGSAGGTMRELSCSLPADGLRGDRGGW